APVGDGRAMVVTGAGLSGEPSRTATLWAAEKGGGVATTVIVDVAYRPSVWPDASAFGVAVRTLARLAEIVIGTEDELAAATGERAPDAAARSLLDLGPSAVVLKRGAAGASIWRDGCPVVDVRPFTVDILNTLGAGDAFASGFLYGYLHEWPLERAARFGNASGA